MKSKKNVNKNKFNLKSFSEKSNMSENEKNEYIKALRKELKLQSNKIERRYKVIEKHGYKSHEYDIMKNRIKGIKEGYRKTTNSRVFDINTLESIYKRQEAYIDLKGSSYTGIKQTSNELAEIWNQKYNISIDGKTANELKYFMQNSDLSQSVMYALGSDRLISLVGQSELDFTSSILPKLTRYINEHKDGSYYKDDIINIILHGEPQQ